MGLAAWAKGETSGASIEGGATCQSIHPSLPLEQRTVRQASLRSAMAELEQLQQAVGDPHDAVRYHASLSRPRTAPLAPNVHAQREIISRKQRVAAAGPAVPESLAKSPVPSPTSVPATALGPTVPEPRHSANPLPPSIASKPIDLFGEGSRPVTSHGADETAEELRLRLIAAESVMRKLYRHSCAHVPQDPLVPTLTSSHAAPSLALTGTLTPA